jgi:hypothetical protein
MNHTAGGLRDLVNISVSSVLLMMAAANFNATLELPKRANAWRTSSDDVLSLLVYSALILITGLFTWAFWRRRTAGNNLLVSVLNGTTCAFLVGAMIYDAAAK